MLGVSVLILIVLEFALALNMKTIKEELVKSLNPYCTGICSRTWRKTTATTFWNEVLILIVLEFALAHNKR